MTPAVVAVGRGHLDARGGIAVKRLAVAVALAIAFCAGLLAHCAVGALTGHPGPTPPAKGRGVMTIIVRTDASLPSSSQRIIAPDDTYIFIFRERDEMALAGDDAYRAALSHAKDG
jgi:hypothetical protein